MLFGLFEHEFRWIKWFSTAAFVIRWFIFVNVDDCVLFVNTHYFWLSRSVLQSKWTTLTTWFFFICLQWRGLNTPSNNMGEQTRLFNKVDPSSLLLLELLLLLLLLLIGIVSYFLMSVSLVITSDAQWFLLLSVGGGSGPMLMQIVNWLSLFQLWQQLIIIQ